MANPPIQHIPLSSINFDSTTQFRDEIDHETVKKYAEKMVEGTVFPPVVLFHQSEDYYIGDGWHRMVAYQKTGAVTVPAVVHYGTLDDAEEYAFTANDEHGLPLKNVDKNKKVKRALIKHPTLSDRQIAKKCSVSNTFVSNLRNQVSTVDTRQELPTTRTGADGKQYPVNQPPREPIAQQNDNVLSFAEASLPEPQDAQQSAPAVTVPASTAPEKPQEESPLFKYLRQVNEVLKQERDKMTKMGITVMWNALQEVAIPIQAKIPLPRPGKPAKPEKVLAIPDQIFQSYPRRTAKKQAMKAIANAIKDLSKEMGPNAGTYLLERTQVYAVAVSKWPSADLTYVPYPQKWFNQGRYTDDPKLWESRSSVAVKAEPKKTDYTKF